MQPSTQELIDAIPDILNAPKDQAPVSMLCLRPGFGEREFVDSIDVTPEEGIPGERWATSPWMKLSDGSPDPRIQVCVLQKRVLDLVWRDREATPHPGDTFVVDMDLSEENLPAGQLLQVGSAVLRVSDSFNDACVKWQARYGKPAREWVRKPEHVKYRLRGILCSVEQAGSFSNGDLVTKITG